MTEQQFSELTHLISGIGVSLCLGLIACCFIGCFVIALYYDLRDERKKKEQRLEIEQAKIAAVEDYKKRGDKE